MLNVSEIRNYKIVFIVSHDSFLSFLDKPFVATSASANIVFGFVGGVVNLTCRAEAEPAANFTWYRKDKKLSPKKFTMFEEQHTSILQVHFLAAFMCRR